LRELDLQLTLEGTRTPPEDIQDQSSTVEDAAET
jgi:hypothetical protein